MPAQLEAEGVSGRKPAFRIQKHFCSFPAPVAAGAAACARLSCNRAVFISSGSFAPAQPGIFPCFINFWRQPWVNPSPNQLFQAGFLCYNIAQVLLLMKSIPAVLHVMSPSLHNWFPCQLSLSLLYLETKKIYLHISSNLHCKGASSKSYADTSLNHSGTFHFLYTSSGGLFMTCNKNSIANSVLHFFFFICCLKSLQIWRRIGAKTSVHFAGNVH